MKIILSFILLIGTLFSQIEKVNLVSHNETDALLIDKGRLKVAIGNNGSIGDVKIFLGIGTNLRDSEYQRNTLQLV